MTDKPDAKTVPNPAGWPREPGDVLAFGVREIYIGDRSARWCTHCNLFSDWPPTAESHHAGCPYVALAASVAQGEALERWPEAIAWVRDHYPEDVFLPGSDSLDAKGARMARLTCDNIVRHFEEVVALAAGEVKHD